MTVEDALIALLAVVAGILLFVGLAQVLDGGVSRRGRRRPQYGAAPLSYGARAAGAPAPARAPVPTSDWFLDGTRDESPQLAAGSVAVWSPGGTPSAPPAPSIAREAPIEPEPGFPEPLPEAVHEPAPEPAPSEGVFTAALAGRSTSVEPPTAPVEVCARHVLAGRYADALAAAEPRLAGRASDAPAESSLATAGLWSLAALSRHAQGDEGGADAAFAAALAGLPRVVEEGCPPGLAAMSMPIARRLLEWAEHYPEGSKERLIGPRLAAFWLRWRLIAAPGDADAEALLDAARAAVSEGHAVAVTALIGHQQWREAARGIGLARDAGELGEVRAELLREVLASSLRREIERLTAPVIRGVKNEGRALGALDLAESTLAAVQELDLPARQRVAMGRRIWRGYAKLGMARLQAGNLDAAADALLHALGLPEIGRRRQRHVRDALVKAIESAGDENVDHVTKLLAEGDRPRAVERVDAFAALIERARERGVPEKELTAASAKARVLARLIEPAS
jgi:hypothetical protein